MQTKEWDIEIGDLFSEAWARVDGSKMVIFGAFFIYAMALIVIQVITEGFTSSSTEPSVLDMTTSVTISILAMPITIPLVTGLIFLGIKRAQDKPIETTMVFDYFVKVWPLVILNIVMLILIYLGLFLLVLPGIYLSIAYAFAIPLSIEKNLGIWDSLELSRKSVTRHWFKVFFVYLLSTLAIIASIFTLGIALIWTVPLVMITYGILYREIFSDEQIVTDNRPLHYT